MRLRFTMKVDAELMFECLIYLNVFYYPLFFICETILVAAKWQSAVPTPGIEEDASVIFAVLALEIGKILIYRKFKDRKRGINHVLIQIVYIMFCRFSHRNCCFYDVFYHRRMSLYVLLAGFCRKIRIYFMCNDDYVGGNRSGLWDYANLAVL